MPPDTFSGSTHDSAVRHKAPAMAAPIGRAKGLPWIRGVAVTCMQRFYTS